MLAIIPLRNCELQCTIGSPRYPIPSLLKFFLFNTCLEKTYSGSPNTGRIVRYIIQFDVLQAIISGSSSYKSLSDAFSDVR